MKLAVSQALPVPCSTKGILMVLDGTREDIWSLEARSSMASSVGWEPGVTSRNIWPIAELHNRYGAPVIMYDQLGCGASTHLRDTQGDTSFWTIELFIAELRNLTARLGLKQYDVLGHSWGGMVAGSFVLIRLEGLRKLVIFSSPAILSKRVKAPRRQRGQLPEKARDALLAGQADSDKYEAAMTVFMQHHMCRIDPWPQAMLDAFQAIKEDNTTGSTIYGGTAFDVPGPAGSFDISGN